MNCIQTGMLMMMVLKFPCVYLFFPTMFLKVQGKRMGLFFLPGMYFLDKIIIFCNFINQP